MCIHINLYAFLSCIYTNLSESLRCKKKVCQRTSTILPELYHAKAEHKPSMAGKEGHLVETPDHKQNYQL